MKTTASAGKRFLAFLMDWYLSSLLGSIPVITIQSIQNQDFVMLNQLEGLSLPLAWIACFLALLVHFFYYCYIPYHSGKTRCVGQTWGMQLMHLQLLTETQTPVSLGTLTVRHMLFFLILQGYLTSSNIYLVSLFQLSTGRYIVPYVQVFYYITVLLSLGMYLFSKRKQLLHDRLTRTKMYLI